MSSWNCVYCGKEHNWKGHSFLHKYCNNYCQQEAQYLQRLTEWKKENRFAKGTIKRYLAEKKEGCYTCGITEWQGKKIVLEIEHKDGNSENNTEENLSLLCPNCHSQTDTYKGKNRGKGRHNRRVRYANGQSF